MQEAIKHYMEVLRKKGINNIHRFPIGYPKGKALENMDAELKRHFDAGEIFVKRQEHSEFEIFRREVGYSMPKDISDFLNDYWQPGIFGYYKNLPACFLLFSALKNKDEGPDDFLLRPDSGLIAEAKRWVSYGGDLSKYLPIGIYDPYAALFLLYEVETGRIFLEDYDNEGIPETEPVADSLNELIFGLYLLD